MVTVTAVSEKSYADIAGILPGDIIISVNGNNIKDILDYRFYTTEKKIEILVHRGPELLTFKITKGQYEDIGLDFETYLMDKKHSCTNKCIFCFIDQNPQGMRESIYFKDDDSRLSFLMGNYITLTNMSEADIDRIIKMRTSPINISVHTTEPELRCKMLNNRFAGKVLTYIDRLTDAGIAINAQIVLCKGVNDGAHLEKTLTDLERYYPNVQSVAIVPAGLTKYREGLFPLEQFSKDEASAVIDLINSHAQRAKDAHGVRLFYPSDEFYLLSGRDIPDEDYYDGYLQIENGVGMLTSLKTEFFDELEFINDDYDTNISGKFSIATGKAAYPLLCDMAKSLSSACKNLNSEVFAIENNFFGSSITVAGLICGCDLISQLKGKDLGDVLFISSCMLRDEGDLFLDGVSLDEACSSLGVPIICVDSSGSDFIGKIMQFFSNKRS